MRTALNIDLEVSRTLNTLATMSSFICEILDIAGLNILISYNRNLKNKKCNEILVTLENP